MSDEMKTPDDLRLSDELAACEARLASEGLAPLRIDRDQLLYSAGWAACEAEASRSVVVAPSTGPRGGVIAAWSITSSVLAASLAVAVTHAIMSPSRPQLVEQQAVAERPLFAGEAPKSPSDSYESRPRQSSSNAQWPDLDAIVAQLSLANRRPPAAALLAVFERPAGSRWDEPIIVSHSSGASSEPSLSATPTARFMLDQILSPGRSRASAPAEEQPSSPSNPQSSHPLSRVEEAI